MAALVAAAILVLRATRNTAPRAVERNGHAHTCTVIALLPGTMFAMFMGVWLAPARAMRGNPDLENLPVFGDRAHACLLALFPDHACFSVEPKQASCNVTPTLPVPPAQTSSTFGGSSDSGTICLPEARGLKSQQLRG